MARAFTGWTSRRSWEWAVFGPRCSPVDSRPKRCFRKTIRVSSIRLPYWPMQNDPHNSPLSKEALSRNHESENPAIGRILFVAGLVALLMIGSLAIIWALMVLLMRARPLDRTARERSVITAPNQQPLDRFLAPHLQVDPHQDWVI